MKTDHLFQFLRDFLNSKVPEPERGKMPKYYRRVLGASNVLLAAMYLIILLLSVTDGAPVLHGR